MREVAGPLLRLARRWTRDEQLAEDLVQDTIYRGLRRLRQLRSAAAGQAWFRAILVSRWRDWLRRRGPEQAFLEDVRDEPVDAGIETPQALLEAEELRRRLDLALTRLTPGQRTVLSLSVDEQLSVAEIAAALGSTPSRVKASLWQARQRVRAMLERPSESSHCELPTLSEDSTDE